MFFRIASSLTLLAMTGEKSAEWRGDTVDRWDSLLRFAQKYIIFTIRCARYRAMRSRRMTKWGSGRIIARECGATKGWVFDFFAYNKILLSHNIFTGKFCLIRRKNESYGDCA